MIFNVAHLLSLLCRDAITPTTNPSRARIAKILLHTILASFVDRLFDIKTFTKNKRVAIPRDTRNNRGGFIRTDVLLL